MPETAWDTEIPDDFYRCCTLDDGHDGPCVWVCKDCNGTSKCWLCKGYAGEDDVTDCSECDGTGGCFRCYEGMEVQE